MTRTYVRYARHTDRQPFGCVMCVVSEDGTTKWGMSVCSPNDHFTKAKARLYAERSLERDGTWQAALKRMPHKRVWFKAVLCMAVLDIMAYIEEQKEWEAAHPTTPTIG